MKQRCESDMDIVRSGTRIRESVRCLPRGHFQQIRQMFDKQAFSTQNLSTIHKQQQILKQYSPKVTNDLNTQNKTSTDMTDIVMEGDTVMDEDFLTEFQILRTRLMTRSLMTIKQDEPFLDPDSSNILDNELHEGAPHSSTLLPQQIQLLPVEREKPILTADQRRQLIMSTALNYADSYESSSTSNHLNRIGSTRQYVSNLQRTLPVHAKPVLVKTTYSVNKHNPPVSYDASNKLFQSSRSLQSTASLSSTGYDSNSSPSSLSKRNSLINDRSQNHSLSSDEHQSIKPWIYESGIETPITNPNSYSSDEVFDHSPLVSHSKLKLNHPTSSIVDHHPMSAAPNVAAIRTSSVFDSPSISSTSSSSSSSAKFIVQTTSFPDSATDDKRNHLHDRLERFSLRRRQKLDSTSSTGFQTQQRPYVPSPVVVQKLNTEREESPLPIVENPLFQQLPPRKPPRTFEHETRYNGVPAHVDQKVPSSSSSTSDSPTFDLGVRSVSCMDLTAGVSSALLSSGLLSLNNEELDLEYKSNSLFDSLKKNPLPNENIYEELKTPLSTLEKVISNDNKSKTTIGTAKSKINQSIKPKKSSMKKGVSEPNLAKTKASSTFFSPRALINRVKRILPLSSSKQSLNEKSINDSHGMTIDSDDSISISSENNDDVRTSRLDHVSRVRNVYDSLGSGNQMKSLFTDFNHSATPRELATLYDYVVQIVSEQELGYFAHGTGCLSSSNLNLFHPAATTPSSVRFKYPFDAADEPALKHFCFPDQHDSNNNHNLNSFLSPMKTKPEYFRFTLTDMYGARQHGYCSRFLHKGCLNALCILSPYDMMEVYEKILSTATHLFLSYKDEDAKLFLQEIYPHRLPNRGDTIHIYTTSVGLYALKCEYDRRKQLIDSIGLLSLSTETIIKIFSSILYEQKLIFIGSELGPLTRLINTFIGLLYPFLWPHTYIPILPAVMLEVAQAPTPYIIGILRSCEPYLFRNDELASQDNFDVLIVDIDHDRVRSLNDYLLNESYRSSTDNITKQFQILPKIFKIELKQEISYLRKNKSNLSIDECQQRLQNVFMSIFVQSCYNYRDYLKQTFDVDQFVQTKQHSIELFLEWFTRTQIFELFIRKKLDINLRDSFALTFDLACEKYRQAMRKQAPQRITVKSVKRKAAERANERKNS